MACDADRAVGGSSIHIPTSGVMSTKDNKAVSGVCCSHSLKVCSVTVHKALVSHAREYYVHTK